MLSPAAVLFVSALLPQAGSEPPKEKQAEYRTHAADIHRTHRRFDEAIAVYRQALAIAPDYAPARRGLGNVFDLIGRHAEARVEYQAGLERASKFEDQALLRDLATSYVFERRFDEAHAALQRSADLNVQRHGQSQGYLPLFFDLAMARDAFDEAERVMEMQFERLKKPAARARSQGSDADEVMTPLEWASYKSQCAVIAARRGRAAEARRLLVEAEAQLAKFDQMLAAVAPPAASNALRSNASIDSMVPAGEAAFWLGDTARAIRVLSRASVKLPRYNLLLGQAYEREQQLVEARAAYTLVVESTLHSIGLAWARPMAQARLAAIGR